MKKCSAPNSIPSPKESMNEQSCFKCVIQNPILNLTLKTPNLIPYIHLYTTDRYDDGDDTFEN